MTTDTVPKTAHLHVDGDRGAWTVGGMAKGAGMLAPGLATMLCVITTDAVVDAETADAALRTATRRDVRPRRLRRLHVDLRHGHAAGLGRQPRDPGPRGLHRRRSRRSAASSPAPLVADAEGATHDIAVTVMGAETAGRRARRRPCRDPLQPVQGRHVRQRPQLGPGARARSGPCRRASPPFDPDQLDVTINGVQVCKAGGAFRPRSEVDLAANREVHVLIDLHAGGEVVTVWTNDLTHDYVHENSAYST